jgi:hypothetical protein
MSKTILKDGMIRWVKSQTLEVKPTQDFNQMQWQSKNNFEMMLKNECSCTFFEIFFWKWFVPLSNNYLNDGMEI